MIRDKDMNKTYKFGGIFNCHHCGQAQCTMPLRFFSEPGYYKFFCTKCYNSSYIHVPFTGAYKHIPYNDNIAFTLIHFNPRQPKTQIEDTPSKPIHSKPTITTNPLLSLFPNHALA